MIKANKIISLASLVAITLGTSCKSHSNVMRGDEYSGEDFINIDINDKAAPIVIGQDDRPSRQHSSDKSYQTSNRRLSTSQSIIDGEWIIMETDGYEIMLDEDMPYVIFSESEGRFYAYNGCNMINGDYTYKNDKSLAFSNVLSTMKLCPDTPYGTAITNVFGEGKSATVKIEKEGNESYMYMYDTNRMQLMKLRRHNLEILNGQWAVAEIEDEEVDGDEVNVFFDIPELKIHGNTGCNYFNGIITPDPEVPSSISFAQMAVTMMSCPNQEIERLMLVGLEETTTYSLQNNNNILLLLDENGKTRIKLIRQ